MAPPYGPWADLSTDLLRSVADVFLPSSLRDYVRLRGVCAAWRAALAPPFPCLLVLRDAVVEPRYAARRSPLFDLHASVVSLPLQGAVRISTAILYCHSSHVVGSSSGYIAIALGADDARRNETVLLRNPAIGEEFKLPPHPSRPRKLALAPGSRPGRYAALAVLDGEPGKAAFVTSAEREWTLVDVVVADGGGGLVDVCWDPESRWRRAYFLEAHGDVHVLQFARGRGEKKRATAAPLLPRRRAGTAGVFPPGVGESARAAFAKSLFLCDGGLHQEWCSAGEVLALRYFGQGRRRRPCWEEVRDLGGYSVFVDRNSAALVRGEEGVPGVTRPNCVYWIDGFQGAPMESDMARGTSSTHCDVPSSEGNACCWYFAHQ